MNRLFRDRRGTAEIVGSILFLVILLFFFTNVYLWHDQATRRMDTVVTDRVNSGVSMELTGSNDILLVTNDGGVGFSLSRLWIITSDNHNYADFEKGQAIWVEAGSEVSITLLGITQIDPVDGSYLADGVGVYYGYPPSGKVTFKILTNFGNTAGVSITL